MTGHAFLTSLRGTLNFAPSHRKWDSFRKHVARKHSQLDLDNIERFEEVDVARNLDNEDEENRRLQEQLRQQKRNAALFLINTRETCRISQIGMETVKEGVVDLFRSQSAISMKEIKHQADPETSLIHVDVVNEVLFRQATLSKIFPSLQTKYLLDKFLIQDCNMIFPDKAVLGKSLKWKSKDGFPDLIEIDDSGYIVSFIENLKMLLTNDEVRAEVENGRINNEGVYTDVLDGSYYKDHIFRNNENRLAIILYYDDLVVTNQLSTVIKKHKLAMFYWTLANIRPQLRSNLNAIQLYAIAKTQHIKKHGIGSILKSFINDIRTLETEGVSVFVENEGREKIFRGSLLFVAGDTPASAAMAGFKESVSAFRMCRTCLTNNEDWKHHFTHEHFEERNIESHLDHCSAITEEGLSEASRKFWSMIYGVNSASPLLAICDVTKCFPQDIMHVLLEGICEISIRAFLRYYVTERRAFNLGYLNEVIEHFNYGYFKDDKPSQIEPAHINADSSLKQTASQINTLLHTLPFLVYDCIAEKEDEHVQCYTLLLQIVNICFSYEIHFETLDLLAKMIELFCMKFTKLYPDTIVPKFHFLTHIIMYIRLHGLPRYQSCLRYESEHAYYRSITRIVRSFKNLPFTLSYRKQVRMCSRIASCDGTGKKFLYQGDDIDPGDIVLLQNLPMSYLYFSYVDEIERQTIKIMRTPRVKSYGTCYKPGLVVLLECPVTAYPIFGCIDDIFVIKKKVVLVYTVLQTDDYDEMLNAYKVAKPQHQTIRTITLNNLIFPHPIPSFKLENTLYVLLLNHENTEFYG